MARALFVAGIVIAMTLLQGAIALSQSVFRSTLIPEGRLKNDVSTEVATPHIPWGRPLVGNAIKVLFVGPAYGQRETAEVAQRLSMDYDVLFSGTTTSWTQAYLVVGQSRAEDVLEQLRNKLSTPRDCVVIGNLDWNLLPDDIVESIGVAVTDGMGLVYVMYDQAFPSGLLALMRPDTDVPQPFATVPMTQLQGLRDADGEPVLTSLPEVQNYRLGKGRVTLIRYPDVPAQGVHFLTADPNHSLSYEYCQSFLIKQIRYAAGRMPPIQINSIEVPSQIQSSRLQSTIAQVRFAGKSGAEALAAKWSIRNEGGEVLASGSQPVAPAAAEVLIALSHLPAGLTFFDVSLQNANEEVIDWASTSFSVISSRSIADIHLLNDTIPLDGEIAGHVALNGGTPESPVPQGCTLRLKLFDNEQRLYADVSLPDRTFIEKLGVFAQSSYLWFSLPVKDGLTTIQRVRAELRDGDGNVLSVAEREFYVPRYPTGDFVVGVWGSAERIRRWSHIADQLSRHQKQIGVDAELVGHYYVDPASKLRMSAGLTRANISVYPYVERISNFETSLARNPCLTDPVYLKRRLAEHREWAHGLGKLGCIAFNLGDEVNLSAQGVDVCFSPSCQASFRTWLQKAYGTIDKLNQSWGTQYTSWDEAGPITRADAEATGSMARWLDHRLHMTDILMNYMRKVADVYAAEIPEARSGPEGIWGTDPYFGVDWGQLAAQLEVVIPYMDEPLAFTAAGSLAREGSLSGTWMGGYPHRGLYEGMARYDPWYALLHGLNSAWFYCNYDGTTAIHPYGAFAPDFRLNQAGEWFFSEIARIKSGLGKLILNSDRQRDGIAILYSSPSAYLQPSTASDLILALRDAGYQVDVITIRQVIDGGLQKFRVLVLPAAIAMSDAEIAAITQFVKAGGIVIADIIPATHDEHGHRRARSPALDLFGVSESADTSATAPSGTRTQIAPTLGVDVTNGTTASSQPISVKLGNAQFNEDVEIIRPPQENAPEIGIRSVEQGKAVLLNFTLSHYVADRQYSRQQSIPVLFQSLLQKLDLLPAHAYAATEGTVPLQGLELIRHRFTGGELLSILREDLTAGDNEPRRVTIRFACEYHVIDLQNYQSLGKISQLEMTTSVGTPALYALLDTAPEPFTATLPQKVYLGQDVTIKIHDPSLPQTVCRIEWIAPDGNVRDAYSTNAVVADHNAVVTIKLALNDPQGKWSVRVTHVLTGQTVIETFDVE